MEKKLKKLEGKDKKGQKGTGKGGLASKLSPKAQRKKDKLLSNTAQLKVSLTQGQGHRSEVVSVVPDTYA